MQWAVEIVGATRYLSLGQGEPAMRLLRVAVREALPDNAITSVLDLGCGDGLNASLIDAPNYTGVDISLTAIKSAMQRCRGQSKQFSQSMPSTPSELTLSMDVAYHLVEDGVFERYLRDLGTASRYCLIYSTDADAAQIGHVRHRVVSEPFLSINQDWSLVARAANPIYGAQWRDHPHFMVFVRR